MMDIQIRTSQLTPEKFPDKMFLSFRTFFFKGWKAFRSRRRRGPESSRARNPKNRNLPTRIRGNRGDKKNRYSPIKGWAFPFFFFHFFNLSQGLPRRERGNRRTGFWEKYCSVYGNAPLSLSLSLLCAITKIPPSCGRVWYFTRTTKLLPWYLLLPRVSH